MRVVVTGASGYVGEQVCRTLTQGGHEVVGISRHQPRAFSPEVRWKLGDARTMNLADAFQGCEAVVHLIGIIREIPAQQVTFDAMHVEVTQRVLNAIKEAEVPRLVHMSALGTKPGATSRYHQTKWRAEELVRQAALAATIMRPSLLFGGSPPFFGTLTDLARLPTVPVPGDGMTLFQPVSREDVAQFVLGVLTDQDSVGRTFEMAGPERFTLNQLIDLMARRLGRPKPPKMHLPLSLVGMISRLSSILPIPITPDQLAMLTEANVTDDTAWQRWVPHPRSLSDWVKTPDA